MDICKESVYPLAAGIVKQACVDYVHAMCYKPERELWKGTTAGKMVGDCERIFKSKWFLELTQNVNHTEVSGDTVCKKLLKENLAHEYERILRDTAHPKSKEGLRSRKEIRELLLEL